MAPTQSSARSCQVTFWVRQCAVHTIKDEEIDALQRRDQAGETTFATRLGEIGEQAGNALVEDREAIAAGSVAKRASQPRFAGAGRTDDDEMVVLADPLAGGEALKERAVETTSGAIVDILIAVFCIVSWRVFWMTMLNRSSPNAIPQMALTDPEMKLLDHLVKDRGGDCSRRARSPTMSSDRAARRILGPSQRSASRKYRDLARTIAAERHRTWSSNRGNNYG